MWLIRTGASICVTIATTLPVVADPESLAILAYIPTLHYHELA